MPKKTKLNAALSGEPTWLSNWHYVGPVETVLLVDDSSTFNKEAPPASQSTRSAGFYDPFRRVFLRSRMADAPTLSVGQHPANPFATER